MSFKAGPLTNDSFEIRFRDCDVVRNSMAIAFCCQVGAAPDHDADPTNVKVAALDKTGWLQLKLQIQIPAKHLWRKGDLAKVAGDQFEFQTRSKQQRWKSSLFTLFWLARKAADLIETRK